MKVSYNTTEISLIINTERKFLFVHNPKAAGTSIRKALLQVPGTHDIFRFQGFLMHPEKNYLEMCNLSHLEWRKAVQFIEAQLNIPETVLVDEYQVVGTFRDPFSRFCSAILEFESKHRLWWSKFNMPVIDFLWEMLTPESIWLPEFSWFQPQHCFFPLATHDESVGPRLSLKFHKEPIVIGFLQLNSETLNNSLGEIAGIKFDSVVGRENARGSSDWSRNLTREELAKVGSMCERLYRDDYRFAFNERLLDSIGSPYYEPRSNMDSYMWMVRSVQTPKTFGICPRPFTGPEEIRAEYEKVKATEPPVIRS